MKNFFPKSDFYYAQNKFNREWLDKQAHWYDIDLAKSFALGLVIGVLIGLII